MCTLVKVFENLRQKLRLSSYTPGAKTNILIWGCFLSTTMKSSVHLGLQSQENLVAHRNTNFEWLKTFFDVTLKLIVEQSLEILNVFAPKRVVKSTTFPNTQRTTSTQILKNVLISTFSFAIFDASHICNDSVMNNRSLTERKLSLLCRRYVTPGTDEADISFGNVALFFRLEIASRT